MNRKSRFIWVNGSIQPDDVAVFPAGTKGSMYGAGCFETFRGYSGSFLHLDRHIRRFNRGLSFLNVPARYWLEEKPARTHIGELLKTNRLLSSDSTIRIQGLLAGGRGYSPDDEEEVDIVITADPLRLHSGEYRLATSAINVIPASSRPPDLKLSNTIHYMKAWQEAGNKGADDSLMLNQDGFIAETAVANIFWKKGDRIYTPSGDCDILPGIMRNILCRILSENESIVVEEGTFPPHHIREAELVWVSNSVKEIQVVSAIDEAAYPETHPFFDNLFEKFQSYKVQYLS